MESMHIRQMLKKIDSKKYNLEPTFKELEELEIKAEIAMAVRWFNKHSRGYREYYVFNGQKIDIDGIVCDYKNYLKSVGE